MKERSVEALERARQVHTTNVVENKKSTEYIFTELKESEDESIRKEIISALQYANHKGVYDKHLAWLEKQGDIDRRIQEEIEKQTKQQWKAEKQDEQNHADKVEPKFKQGEWIVWKDKNYKVNYNGCGYELFDQNGLSTSWDYKTIEDNAHLWAIQDAKNGDVLAFDNDTIVMFKDLYNSTTFHSYCHIEDGIFDSNKDELPDWWEGEGFKPATKEQRDLLFQKMKEAGYEWDAEKKKLNKIEQSELTEFEDAVKDMMNAYRDDIGDNDVTTEEVKKHAAYLLSLIHHKTVDWSEEDDRNLSIAIQYVFQHGYLSIVDWLKSLKDRVQPQWKPSGEELNALDIAKDRNDKTGWYLCELYKQLKKL